MSDVDDKEFAYLERIAALKSEVARLRAENMQCIVYDDYLRHIIETIDRLDYPELRLLMQQAKVLVGVKLPIVPSNSAVNACSAVDYSKLPPAIDLVRREFLRRYIP